MWHYCTDSPTLPHGSVSELSSSRICRESGAGTAGTCNPAARHGREEGRRRRGKEKGEEGSEEGRSEGRKVGR